jgi:hypothetical protein
MQRIGQTERTCYTWHVELTLSDKLHVVSKPLSCYAPLGAAGTAITLKNHQNQNYYSKICEFAVEVTEDKFLMYYYCRNDGHRVVIMTFRWLEVVYKRTENQLSTTESLVMLSVYHNTVKNVAPISDTRNIVKTK